jgi:Fic family protein
VDLESRAILKACIAARAAVAELKQAGRLLPNPDILINTIPLLEAQTSSEIENIVTTTDALFRFAQPDREDSADSATKEALRYRTALRRGVEAIASRPLSSATAVTVCQTILGLRVDVRKVPGTALTSLNSGRVVYTPPEGVERIRGLLGNLDRFLHEETDLDPLVRMAVGHYQFEAIHPFTDGNGRTGRIINLLFLIDQGLLDLPVLYLSRAIIRNKNQYYKLLLEVTTKQAWEPWVLYMLRAVQETAVWTTNRIERVQALLERTRDVVRERAPGAYSRELVELVFVQPYCRISNVVDAGLGHRQTAARHLRALVTAGVLKEVTAGRERLFINPRLMRLLTADEPGRLDFE